MGVRDVKDVEAACATAGKIGVIALDKDASYFDTGRKTRDFLGVMEVRDIKDKEACIMAGKIGVIALDKNASCFATGRKM